MTNIFYVTIEYYIQYYIYILFTRQSYFKNEMMDGVSRMTTMGKKSEISSEVTAILKSRHNPCQIMWIPCRLVSSMLFGEKNHTDLVDSSS